MSIAAILIATARTAEGEPIGLLPVPAGMTLVEWQIAEWRFAGVHDIEVVLNEATEALMPYLSVDGVEPVIAPPGAAGALRAGATAVPRGTMTSVLSHIERPRPASKLRPLLDAHVDRTAAITRPAHGGVAGTPLVLSEDALAWLRNVRDERGVDALLERWRNATIEIRTGDAAVLREVRSAEDLAGGIW